MPEDVRFKRGWLRRALEEARLEREAIAQFRRDRAARRREEDERSA